MNKPNSQKYRTTNWSSYNAALKARGSLDVWFDPDMQWVASPCGKRGRSQTFSDAAIQVCLMIKSLFQLALRQTTGLVASLLRLCGLAWTAPDFSTLSRRQKHIDINFLINLAKVDFIYSSTAQVSK
jgi:hypothetical protein